MSTHTLNICMWGSLTIALSNSSILACDSSISYWCEWWVCIDHARLQMLLCFNHTLQIFLTWAQKGGMSPHFARSLLRCSRKHRASRLSCRCPSSILGRWNAINLFIIRLQGLSWGTDFVSILIDQTGDVSGTRIFAQFRLRSFTGFLCWIIGAKLSACNCGTWLLRS